MGLVDRPKIRVVSAELQVGGRFLLTQRRSDAVLGGLWEFPGGRVRDGESDAQALQRAVADRLGASVSVHECTMEVVHEYEGYTLMLAVYRCVLDDGEKVSPRRVQDVAWVSPDRFGQYTFPGADQKTVDLLVTSMDD